MALQIILAVILLNILHKTEGIFPHLYPKSDLSRFSKNGDTGDPLYLTPYIKQGKINEAQTLARVELTDNLRIESYSGFLTVNEKYDSNMFFWFFPVVYPEDYDTAPVVLWLQGGPGASSLYGLFVENGPLVVSSQSTMDTREIHWALYHHLIYIDNPVGTGFSFTNSSNGFVKNEIEVGRDLYLAITQFFELFPKLKKNKFYITGESYAGKYVPALAYTIHNNNENSFHKINLQGLAIGNGYSDPVNQLDYGKYLYEIGLIDSNQRKIFEYHQDKTKEYIKNKQWDSAIMEMDLLMDGDLHNGQSIFKNFTGYSYYYNYLQTDDNIDVTPFLNFLNKNHIRKQIHVGNLTFNSGLEVQLNLKDDGLQSVAPWISELLSNYRILIYSGQLDIIVAYPLTENYLKKLKFNGSDEYKSAERKIWKVAEKIAGYVKVAGNLTEILVRACGHMVPTAQPKWALDMITRFTLNKPFV